MKVLSTLCLLVLVAVAARATDPTTEMLNARYVEDFITLSLAPGNDGKAIVKYTADDNDSPKTAQGMTFRTSGEIAIHLDNLNPLTQAWVVKAESTPDVSYTAIKAFLDDLIALQKALPQQLPPGGGGLGDEAVDSCQGGGGCARLCRLIKAAYQALSVKEITPPGLHTLVTGAHGQAGVETASRQLATTQADIEKNNTNARAALTQIRADYSALDPNVATQKCEGLLQLPLPAKGELSVGGVTGQLLVDYIHVHSTAERIIATKQALHKQLGEIVAMLQPYTSPAVWHGATDYIVRAEVKPTFAAQQNIAVAAKERTMQLVGDSIVVKTDDANVITSEFSVRKNSFVVAERAAAVVYNNLKYPQYGTTTNAAGKTVVEQTDDHDPINGALMLNLVMRLGRGVSVTHPLLQFGVSSAKEYPGFLAGLGLRFVEPFNFSISAGGLITRYKDLDGALAVGDVVSGTADIDKHLEYKTSPVAIYGAIQVKF